MVVTMGLFAPMMEIKAASQNFSFCFDQAVVDGSLNGKFYSINKTVTAAGSIIFSLQNIRVKKYWDCNSPQKMHRQVIRFILMLNEKPPRKAIDIT